MRVRQAVLGSLIDHLCLKHIIGIDNRLKTRFRFLDCKDSLFTVGRELSETGSKLDVSRDQ